MLKKLSTLEQIVAKLREIEVASAHGKSVDVSLSRCRHCRSELLRWRKE